MTVNGPATRRGCFCVRSVNCEVERTNSKNLMKITTAPLRLSAVGCYPSGLGARPRFCLETHETTTQANHIAKSRVSNRIGRS